MKNTLLFASTALAMMLASVPAFAWAKDGPPSQSNKGGNPAQAQVYGDGSAASASRSSSDATGGTSLSNATGGKATATGGTSLSNAQGGKGGTSNANAQGGKGGTSTSTAQGGKGGLGGTADVVVNVAAPTAPAGGSGKGNPSGDSAGAGDRSNSTKPATNTHRPSPRQAPNGNGGGSGGGTGYVNQGEGYGRIPVATAVAPNVQSFNSCAGSAMSGALQTGLVGLSFGSGNKFDRVCWLNQSGRSDAAIEYICAIDSTAREALKHTAHPCAEDVQTVPVAAEPDTRTKYQFDFCSTRNAGDRDQHKECDHPAVTAPVVSSTKDNRGLLARVFN